MWQFAEHKKIIKKHKTVDSNSKRVYNIIIEIKNDRRIKKEK